MGGGGGGVGYGRNW